MQEDSLIFFFKIDRYTAVRQPNNEYNIVIYDVDETLDVVEDSMTATAKELQFDIKNTRSLIYYGEGSVKMGLDINGKGIGMLRYQGNSEQTKVRLEAFIEVNTFGDVLLALGSFLLPDKYSQESINNRGKIIQEELDFATKIIKSDEAYTYIQNAYELGRISESFLHRSKKILDTLRQ